MGGHRRGLDPDDVETPVGRVARRRGRGRLLLIPCPLATLAGAVCAIVDRGALFVARDLGTEKQPREPRFALEGGTAQLLLDKRIVVFKKEGSKMAHTHMWHVYIVYATWAVF